MFAVNYTWMKLEDKVTFFTDYDTTPYRDIQGDQRRHRLVITTLVDLPFGPGKPIGGNTPGPLAHPIGGRAVNHNRGTPARRPPRPNGGAHPPRPPPPAAP